MKNIITFILGLIVVLVLGFLLVYSVGKVGVSYLGLIKDYDEKSTALVEAQQDSIQKDMLIRALLSKLQDKDKGKILNGDFGIIKANSMSEDLNMDGRDINRVFQLDVGNGIYNAYEDKVYILEGDGLQASRYYDDDNPQYYLDPEGSSRLDSLEITGSIDFLYSPCKEYSNSKTGKGNVTVSVSCPKDAHVISGGFLDNSSGEVYLKASVRSGKNGWMCSSFSDTNRTLTCYAYCCF